MIRKFSQFMSHQRQAFVVWRAFFRFLKKHLAILWFPLLSWMSMLVIVSLVVLSVPQLRELFQADIGQWQSAYAWHFHLYYFFIFLLYLGGANFISSFFAIGLMTYVGHHIQGQSFSVLQALRLASRRMLYLLGWVCGVGPAVMLLKSFVDMSCHLAQRVCQYLGVSFEAAHFICLPIVVFEHKNHFAALKQGGLLWRQHETFNPEYRMTFGLFWTLMWLPFFLLIVATFMVAMVPLKITLVSIAFFWFMGINIWRAIFGALLQVITYLHLREKPIEMSVDITDLLLSSRKTR